MFALSRSLGRTTKDNGCYGLVGNCNGEVCRFALVLAAMGGEELMGQCVGGVDGGRKGVFCPNLYSPLCTSSTMNRNI